MKKIMILITLLSVCNAYATPESQVQNVNRITTNKTTEASENRQQNITIHYSDTYTNACLPIIIASLGALAYKGKITGPTFALGSLVTLCCFPMIKRIFR